MGNKGAKLPKKPKLSSKDLKQLSQQTGLSKEQIQAVFDKFNANNPDGQLNRQEFLRLYDELRPESLEKLDEISQYVFGAFDKDNSGSISFSEFLVAFTLTSKGDPQQKLEYAFELYDVDNNNSLDRNELRGVLTAMFDLLGADKRNYNISQLTEECLGSLDASRDGRVSKDEFISLKALMSPFN